SAASEGVQALRGYVATGLVEEKTSTGVRCFSANFFQHLRNRIAEVPVPAGSSPVPFTGGYVGYLGYGMKGAVGIGRAGSGVRPDAELMRVDRFVAFDHELGRRYLVTVGVPEAESTAWFAQVREHALRLSTSPAPAQPYPGGGLSAVSATVDQDTYLRHFDEVQRWLRDGDSYEACYTYQVTARSGEHPYPAYQRLRRQNPAPYAAYLRFGNRSVLSSSPERFVTVTGDRWVETKPIKGTAARHPDPATDAAVSAALAADEKIRSENLMITDLLRNDLGRLCDVGTVHVPHLMAVESYATVHQVVTTIRGRLRPEFDGVGCVAGLFPGGSMTGAPKKRTVELLDDLEPAERGVYSGALGFFGYDGQVDQSIIIRTIVWEDDRLCIGVGGALIVMSDPDEEYEETKLKLRALLRALDPSAESAATARAG
ncbi:MAG TPA: anthranilate synthase component I family protein, partial [Micromonosporaceae bacterium]